MKFKAFSSSCAPCVVLFLIHTGPLLANSPPELEIDDLVVGQGAELNIVLVPKDDDGVVPDLFMLDAPADANLDDNGDGTRTFSWQAKEKGVYSVDFIVQDAQDADLLNRYESQITVVEPGEVPATLQALDAENASGGESNTTSSSEENGIYLGDNAGAVTKLLSDLPVSVSQLSVQQTPIDTSDEYLYVVNIEPGPNGDVSGFDLKTVLRQGRQRSDHSWEWKSVVVEDKTLHNKWHTAPSVAVDKLGMVHVAYNMHNFPWQYKRANKAHDIYSLKFKGQEITDAEIKLASTQNKTNFPTLGTAEIPGNQITYPAFYKDENNDLYVSYRFAAAPKRQFEDRMMSSGIAIYNALTQTWTPIGSNVEHSSGDFDKDDAAPEKAVAFAGKQGWTSYFPKLAFDQNNRMFASIFWRNGIAGQQVTRPCMVVTKDRAKVSDISGKPIAMPIEPGACGNMNISNDDVFYNIGSFAVSKDNKPYLLLSPDEGSRFITRYNDADNRWVQEKAPSGATEIFFDNDNNLYAISSGINIHKRTSDQANWELIYSEGSKKNCYPKVKKDQSGKNAFIHTQSCNQKSVTVYGIRLP